MTLNVVDIVILVIVAIAIVRGLRVGAVVQGLSFGGFWAGLIAGAFLAPHVASYFASTLARAIAAFVTEIGSAFALSAVGEVIGRRIGGVLRRLHLGLLDSAGGAVIGGGAALLASWLVASLLATVPFLGVSSAIQSSAVITALDRRLPSAPSVFSRVQSLIGSHGFPQVFAGLEPAPPPPVATPPGSAVSSVLASDGPSTVKVFGNGCGGALEGSGFIVAPGLVLTNAHVIAGIAHPTIHEAGRVLPATPLLFDPNLDVAVMRVPGLAGHPLSLSTSVSPRGTTGAVLGYPENGSLTAGGAGVLKAFEAVGRNIYGQGLVTREVYELQAVVRPGNSGGPLVAANGTVFGVVFARSVRAPDVGFALTSAEVLPKVKAAEAATAAVGTGACAG
ncbi:MAG: MarP family serine protease [Acidimicrobiales bacterium]